MSTTHNNPDPLILLLDEALHGIYMPQDFAEGWAKEWSGIDPEDIKICSAGPDHDYYWESWDAILNDASKTIAGNTYTLYQDGDLWAICPDIMSPEQYESLFGEPMEQDSIETYASNNGLHAYVLPAYWASSLVNGDDSGMEATELHELTTWGFWKDPGYCVGVYELGFRTGNDANHLAGDVALFLFDPR